MAATSDAIAKTSSVAAASVIYDNVIHSSQTMQDVVNIDIAKYRYSHDRVWDNSDGIPDETSQDRRQQHLRHNRADHNAIDLRGFWPVNWDVTCAACVSPWWRSPALVRHVAGVDRLE